MEKREGGKLMGEISRLLKALNLIPAEAQLNGTKMTVVLHSPDHDVTTDELASAYRIIYPRYSQLSGMRDLVLEVSSPGMQREFRSASEFAVFRGKRVRLYSVSRSSFVTGIIGEAGEDSVEISEYGIESSGEKGEMLDISYSDISKAKLECIWEDLK